MQHDAIKTAIFIDVQRYLGPGEPRWLPEVSELSGLIPLCSVIQLVHDFLKLYEAFLKVPLRLYRFLQQLGLPATADP